MPILDASSLTGKSEDENVLRGILGPATHGPLHADEMRTGAGEAKTRERRRDPALLNAVRGTERAKSADKSNSLFHLSYFRS